MPNPAELQQIPDKELIILIKKDPDYISVVYKKTMDNCMKFMYKMNSGSKVHEVKLEEIFQEAIIVLYENIIYEDFKLTNNSSLQTYLNAVCRFKLLDEFKKLGKRSSIGEAENWIDDLQTNLHDENELKEIKVQDEEQYNAIEKALLAMKNAGGNCYEILSLFWYHGKSNKQIAELLGYTTAVNAKNQKSRCQKRLRKMAHEELMSE